MVTRYVGVHGTWSYRPGGAPEWYETGAPFALQLADAGLLPARQDPFVWSGDLDGTPIAHGNDWEVAAVWLARYLRPLRLDQRNVIAHSHGGAVALFATQAIQIRSLITIGTPARREVREAGQDAIRRKRIGAWVHVSDRRFDLWGQLGALFDGHLRRQRTMDLEGCRDLRLDKIGHSDLLSGTRGDVWTREGLYDVLRGVTR